MYPLFLQFQTINVLNLDGQDPAETVIRSCKIVPAPASSNVGETITETLELILEASWAEITAKIKDLEQLLSLAGHEVIPRDWLYLRYYSVADPAAPGGTGLYDWRSRILSGWLELGNKSLVDRDTESQLVKLHLTRLNYWAGPKTQASAFLPGGAAENDDYEVDNISSHTDVDHDNAFGISGQVTDADLPSPVELRIENTASSDPYADFVISQRLIRGTARLDTGFVEGEDLMAGAGVTKTTPSDASCSAGAYGNFAWTGAGEILLCSWSPSSADLAITCGQVHRPILRLQAANSYDDLWVCVRVLASGNTRVLQESLWMLVPTATLYLELPPINLPPQQAGFDSFRPVDVAIFGNRPSGGTSNLAIDFIQFTPAEIVRRLTSLNLDLPVGAGIYLADSGIDEETYYQDITGAKQLSHVGQGQYLQVVPGYDSMIRVLHRAGGDSVWTVDSLFNFYVYYEPRRRNL